MAKEPRPAADADQSHPNGDRLESWKEIAAYLRRDVRTVQRWESDGLPIRRLRRAHHRAIPYTSKAELDAWWTTRSEDHSTDIEQNGSPKQGPGSATRRFATASVAALIAVALTAGGGYWTLRARSTRTSMEVAPSPFVTTSSKTALRLFSQADLILQQGGDNRAAEALLREAIAADPGFASAHTWLAWSLARQGRASDDYLPFAARAEQLAANATERERLFIHGSAFDLRGQRMEACGAYEALTRLQPDHYWATHSLMTCYREEGDQAAMADMAAKLADLWADGIDENVQAAWANEFIVSNPQLAQEYLSRAEQLQRSGKISRVIFSDPWLRLRPRVMISDPWLRLRPAYKKWLANDVDGALADLTETVKRGRDHLDAYRKQDLHLVAGYFMVTLGRLRDAEQLFDEFTDKGGQPGQIGLVAYAHDDIDRARKLEVAYRGMGIRSAMICARIGLPEQAHEYIQQSTRAGSPQAEAIEGELALHSGEINLAVEHLSAAVQGFRLTTYGGGEEFMAPEALALALESSHRPDDALGVLEAATTMRQHAYDPYASGPLSGYYWLRARVLQAELYARRGRKAEGEQVAREIVQLLARADADFPILQRAKKLLIEQ